MAVLSIAPPLISTVSEVNVLPFATVNPSLADNKLLVDNVVKAPVEAVVPPMAVLSIAPPSISTLLELKAPPEATVILLQFILPLTSNL